MPPKRPAMSLSVAKKTMKSLTLEVKLDIIHRYERGKKTNSIARHHGLIPSTVSTIFKSADSIKKAESSSLPAKVEVEIKVMQMQEDILGNLADGILSNFGKHSIAELIEACSSCAGDTIC
ncbi:CENPB DNA-binding domain-containing protein 1 [Portunus trituberculatus]|uniref:CENPB DNA-binding domain-containing protein 1 n=1 Tax=Portunus trituberculatus TaxID=210409 RepID=A0A5B7DIA6_PORTR|nr:CENPB DNA-binding domain-containing protein 1 [Portunus trituberculatus]